MEKLLFSNWNGAEFWPLEKGRKSPGFLLHIMASKECLMKNYFLISQTKYMLCVLDCVSIRWFV